MIRSFRSKGLTELWNASSTRRIDVKMHKRILVRLDRLNAATTTRELDLPGFDCHALKGHQPTRYSIHVNGPWCPTFEFEEGDAHRVDFEQYH